MILDKLETASFKGFTFLTPKNTTRTGRKVAVHEFVNSDKRFVEDLGAFPNEFSFPAIVHGENAIQLKDSFIEILNKPGPGILIHPTYGSQSVSVKGPYTIDDDDTSLGQFVFKLVFAVDSGPVSPTATRPTTSTISAIEQTTRSSILQRIRDQWITPITDISNSDAAQKLISYAEEIATAYQSVVADASEITEATNDAIQNANFYVRTGLGIATPIFNILNALDAIPTESLGTLTSIKNFIGFGEDDQNILNRFQLSSDQQNRIINRNLLNSTIQATSLTKAYTVSTQVDFLTVTRLDENRSDLAAGSRSVVSKEYRSTRQVQAM